MMERDTQDGRLLLAELRRMQARKEGRRTDFDAHAVVDAKRTHWFARVIARFAAHRRRVNMPATSITRYMCAFR